MEVKVPVEVTALALVSRDLFGTKSFLLSVYTQGLGMEEVEDKNDFLWMEEGDNANFNRQYISSYPAYLDLTVNLITFVA